MKTPARICLVTPGNVASNPRLVKEAQALKAAGYGLRIVAADVMPSLSRYDAEIFAGLGCEYVRVSARRPRYRHVLRAVWQRAARRGLPWLRGSRWGPDAAAWAHHQLTHALAHEAARHPADLYLAHNLAALPAAARAASFHRARLGFDAEDFHCGELEDTPANARELGARAAIERAWLPCCQHLTAASPGIAELYRQRYGVDMDVVLNVFPRAEAPAAPRAGPAARGEAPSLYWFSQTIGNDRGLEAVVEAMGRMQTRAFLRLRGHPVKGYLDALRTLAARSGGEDLVRRIEVLPVAPPSKMARLAAEHDLGLALERTQPLNRALCLTNKIFVYLLAGLPICLSRTPAQETVAGELGEAAFLADLGNSAGLARALDEHLTDPGRMQRARAAAWRLACTRFNWDEEQKRFLTALERSLHAEAMPPG